MKRDNDSNKLLLFYWHFFNFPATTHQQELSCVAVLQCVVWCSQQKFHGQRQKNLVIRGMPRWAKALRSEIKRHRDLLTKLEEKQHGKDSRRKTSAQQFIFEFGIRGARRVLNKHNKATTMSEGYCINDPGLAGRPVSWLKSLCSRTDLVQGSLQ